MGYLLVFIYAIVIFILIFYEVERKRGFKWFYENELPGLLHSTHLAKRISQTFPGFQTNFLFFQAQISAKFHFAMNKSHPIAS